MLPELSPIEQVSLYFHIPFCTEKCRYCDFYSEAGIGEKLIDSVIDEILLQAVWFIEKMRYPRVRTVYIGGGTPNSIAEASTIKLLEGIREILKQTGSTPDEWSVEVNPEAITSGLLETYAAFGVDRLSVGLQTFSKRLYKVLGRVGSPEDNMRALELISQSWKGYISADIITCIPGQTAAEAREDILQTLKFKPDHISLYTLIVEPNTPFAADVELGIHRPMSVETAEKMWLDQACFLVSEDYAHYEISNFCTNNKKCLHNLTYWNLEPYAGCGPGSVSTLFSGSGPVRLTNPSNIQDYQFGQAGLWELASETLEGPEFLFEHLMMGLRLDSGIDLQKIHSIFGIDLPALLDEAIRPWIAKGYLILTSERMVLSSDGRLLLNTFLGDIMSSVLNSPVSKIIWPN
ncbi:MAG: radical SAM family heme chaperone HemW [Spirochaetales bacterium]|nr:radical SAM family heme chaperone HemW [Spirochaetales bacterium]